MSYLMLVSTTACGVDLVCWILWLSLGILVLVGHSSEYIECHLRCILSLLFKEAPSSHFPSLCCLPEGRLQPNDDSPALTGALQALASFLLHSSSFRPRVSLNSAGNIFVVDLLSYHIHFSNLYVSILVLLKK